MDSINQIFKHNIFSTNPTKFQYSKRAVEKQYRDIFATKETEINKEISMYLDVLYKDSDEELLNKTDMLKLSNAYLPITSKTIHFGDIYL